VRGRLRELRTQTGKDRIRILHFGDAKRWFVLLHGLVKRSQQLSEADIRLAEQRMRRHEMRLQERGKKKT
jgi:phage-related protein